MIRLWKRAGPIAIVLAVVLAAGTGAAYGLRVAWNVDVHQNKFDVANDFHVWGVLESGDPAGNNPPQFVKEVNFDKANPPGPLFPNFNHSITPSATWGGPPFYDFNANWSGASVNNCTWVHFGLEFDETCYNIGYWLQAAWTKDGVDPGFSPMYGFDVDDLAQNQTFTLQNASEVQTEIVQMDLMALPAGTDFPLENLNAGYFADHPELVWQEVNLVTGGGGGGGARTMAGDGSEFVVDIEDVIGRRLGLSEILISRQLSEYTGSGPEQFWQFELHEAHVPEPLTILSVFAGLAGLAGYVRKRKKT